MYHPQFFEGWPKSIESLRRKKLDGGGLEKGGLEKENKKERNVVALWEGVVEMDHVDEGQRGTRCVGDWIAIAAKVVVGVSLAWREEPPPNRKGMKT